MKKRIASAFIILSLMALSAGLKGQDEMLPVTFEYTKFNITVLPEEQRQSSPDRMLGITDEMIKKTMPTGTYVSAVNVFLVEQGNKSILIDAGYGRELFNHLKTCGKSPDDISAILLTHMHGDHIGGLLRDGKKSFPNAMLYISQPEYNYWMSDEAMQRAPENRRGGFATARSVIEAYRDNLQLFSNDDIETRKQEVLPGIKSIATYGHTPGHTAFLLENNESGILIWGDLTHAVGLQAVYPEVAYPADTDPEQSTESRRRVFKYLSENPKIRVAGMHIEHPGLGEVKSNAAGYTFTLLCPCEGIFH